MNKQVAPGELATVTSPALGISLQAKIDDNRLLVFQTHFDADDTDDTINAKVDRVFAIADRKIKRYQTTQQLLELKLNLERHEVAQSDLVADLQRVDEEEQKRWEESGRRGEFKLSAAARTQRKNSLLSAEKFKYNIDKLKAQIAECETILTKV